MPPAFAGNLCARFMQLSYSRGDQLLIRLTTKPPETKYPSTNVLTIELHRYKAWCMRRDWFNRPMSIHLNAFFTTWMQTASSLTIFKNCVDLFIAKRRSGGFLMGYYVEGFITESPRRKRDHVQQVGADRFSWMEDIIIHIVEHNAFLMRRVVLRAVYCLPSTSYVGTNRIWVHYFGSTRFLPYETQQTETLTTWMLVSPVGS